MKTTTDNFKFPARHRALTETERKEAFEAGRETAMDCWFDMYNCGWSIEELREEEKKKGYTYEGWADSLVDGFTRKQLMRMTGCAPGSKAEREWLKQYCSGADSQWMNTVSAELGEG